MKKILLVLVHNRMTGVNTLNLTIAKFLIKNNIDTEIVFVKNRNILWIDEDVEFFNELTKEKIYYTFDVEDYNKYDAVVLNYNFHNDLLNNYRGKKLYIINGIDNQFDNIYDPRLVDDDFKTIAVSKNLLEKYNADFYIPNIIDLEKYNTNKLFNTLDNKNKICFFYSRTLMPEYLLQSLYDFGIQCQQSLMYDSKEYIMKDLLNSSFVIATGRSAYESMALHKNVLIAGQFGMDGWINKINFDKFIHKNCSGLVNEIKDEKQIADVLSEFDLMQQYNNRQIIQENLDAEKLIKKFIDVLDMPE
jgi:hypothetical protein